MEMKPASLKLTIYIAAFLAQASFAHAETVAVSRQAPATTLSDGPAAAPINIVPNEVGEGEGQGVDPRIGASRGNEPEVKKWLKHFDLVVVIDKANQSLTAWRNSSANPADVTPSVALRGPVSSGTETRECLYVRSKVPNDQGLFLFTKARAIFRNTPTGYYVPTKIEASHFSSEYEAAPMPNSVSIIEKEGIYSHSKTADEGPLGRVASHGCVRQSFRDSRDLFTMVAMTSDKFDPNDDAFHARCPRDPDSGKCSRPTDPNEDRELQTYFTNIKNGNYPRVIIDPKNPKNNHDLKSNMPRLTLRNAAERPVLKVEKDGRVGVDPVTNAPNLSTSSYNTLYIVKDSNLGTPKEKPAPAPLACRSLTELNAAVKNGNPDPTGEGRVDANPQGAQRPDLPFNLNPFGAGGIFNRDGSHGGFQAQPQQQQPVRRMGNR
jgi:hypothetical protein